MVYILCITTHNYEIISGNIIIIVVSALCSTIILLHLLYNIQLASNYDIHVLHIRSI